MHMQRFRPLGLIALGVLLMLFSFFAIFAMVLRLVEPGFALSFLAYALSIIGLLLGLLGVISYPRRDEPPF